ncbi:MAG: HEAT repeat domain-containing protein [Phycisphaeraceae bacterium]
MKATKGRTLPRIANPTSSSLSPRRGAWLLCLVLALGALGCQAGESPQSLVAEALDTMGPPSPTEAARDAFNVYDADRRRRAVALLSAAPFGGEDTYVRVYRLLINDPDATVRAACAKALGMHGSVEDADHLTPLLTDEHAFVRWDAAKALQRIHNPVAIDPLLRAVQNDQDADVRMAAAKALGQYAEARVFDVLLGALNDHDFGVVNAAHESLVTLTGRELGTDSRDWLAWSQQHRDALFEQQQRYTYEPYDPPPGIIERMQFWRTRTAADARTPTGLDEPGDDADRASSS